MIETLKKICALQPAYSSANTPEMQERGVLIRSTLPSDIREYEAELRAALGPFASEFDTDASDGIGRKTEALWVRIHARNMSPTARDGFYVVIHFAADGSAVFLTVGCGSTVWTNGELKPVSDAELSPPPKVERCKPSLVGTSVRGSACRLRFASAVSLRRARPPASLHGRFVGCSALFEKGHSYSTGLRVLDTLVGCQGSRRRVN